MFLNPLMLAGLGGAVLPLVLHLLARSRFRTVDWAAMMFLQGVDPRQQQSTRLKQWILLLLRMALVSLLAIALARPLVSDTFAAVASGGHWSSVIVVDGSLSTLANDNGKPRALQIRQAAIAIVSAMQKGDEAALIVAGSGGSPVPMTSDLSTIADGITSIEPAGRSNFAEAMARASELLDKPEIGNRRLFVVCDRQALSWREADAAFRSAWRAHATRGSAATAVTIVPVGGTAADNLAVASLTAATPPIVRDQPAEFEVKIRNFGAVRRPGVSVALLLNGRELTRGSVDCPPDSTVPIRLTARFNEPAPQVVSAVIQPDATGPIGLAADDSFNLAVDITDAARVLLLSGDERSPKPQAESFFANVALQPFASAGRNGGNDPCKVTVMPVTAATDADFQAAQVVILANVPTVSPTIATALEQFIYDGGGVLVAPGSLTRVASYNDQLYRDGAGWLPAKLAQANDTQPTGLGQLDSAHPVLAFMKGRTDLPPVTVGHWYKLAPRSDARSLGTLATGDPFAVECAAGRGRVMLLSGPIDADWSNMPLTNFYLPFMQSAVRWLAGTGADRNLAPGAPIAYAWTSDEPRIATMLAPDGRSFPLEVQRQGDHAEIRFAGTDQVGIYKLKIVPAHGRDLFVPFVVSSPTEESDLTPMRADDWKSLARDLDATIIDANGPSIADVLNGSRSGREIWGLLIISLIVLALGETWLAGRWSRQD